jgi:hypothetical protein
MNNLIKRIFLLASLLFAVPGVSAASVDIVVAENNAAMLNLAHAAEHALQQLQPAPIVSVGTPAAASSNKSRENLLIIIGDDFLDWSISKENPYNTTLYFYINSSSYSTLNNRALNSALFRDQPISRQLQLARLLLPNLHRAIVIHNAPLYPEDALKPLGTNASTVDIRHVNIDEDWAKLLSLWMSDHDVLIGVEDKNLYTRETIRSILLTTYRHGKVLIGPSRGFVAAGSLASTYTSPEQYLQQLQQMVRIWLDTRVLPKPQFPRAYQISVNRQVANSLDLSLPDDEVLLKQLQQQLKIQDENCRDGC